jgi:hypothetical protein
MKIINRLIFFVVASFEQNGRMLFVPTPTLHKD